MSAFSGFPPETRAFLRGLADHNEKEWFDDHRADYERWWLAPAQEFVEAIGPELSKLAPGIRADPRVNGSILRINRDVRFSDDKRPYRDHLDFWFWEGLQRNQAASGFLAQLTSETFTVGVGDPHFDRNLLHAYRNAVVDSDAGRALTDAVLQVEASGLKAHGESYAEPPPGFKADDALAMRFLRFDALWTFEEAPAEAVAGSEEIVEICMAHWQAGAPIHRWLVDSLQGG